ncbi:MAG TPA: BamA/TamA family outer membrane protein, partial [Bdellovibrionota bacterium]|nr:BamA/TamA family outer membrane protein [Bdellovibrionota bacterium]
RRLEDFRYVEYQLQVGYVWPWFLGVPELTFRPELTRERRQYVNFDADSSLFTATWERSLWDRWGLLAGLTYSLEFTRQFHAVDPTDNVNLTIGALIPSLTVDLRDNPLSPTKGFFAKTSFELASTAFLSQSEPFPVSYTRLQGRTDYTAPLGEGASWYFSLRGGLGANLADPHKSDGSIDTRVQIPLIKQFSLGGVQSMRGYKLQELNIQAFAIQGTMAYVNYRTQIDIPLAGNLRFGPFLDSGVLLVDGRLPQPRVNGVGALLPKLGVRYGTGLGLHYQTPVGPVNLDLGFKVAPLPGEDREEFHFSVGVL